MIGWRARICPMCRWYGFDNLPEPEDYGDPCYTCTFGSNSDSYSEDELKEINKLI